MISFAKIKALVFYAQHPANNEALEKILCELAEEIEKTQDEYNKEHLDNYKEAAKKDAHIREKFERIKDLADEGTFALEKAFPKTDIAMEKFSMIIAELDIAE